MIVQEPLQVIVWDSLNHYEYDNAIFLAERLHAEVNSEETAFLLGTCYYRAKRIHEAHHLLQNTTLNLPHAKFLLAKCALEIKAYKEAEAALGSNLDIIPTQFGEQAPYVLQLLGKIYQVTERRGKAMEAYQKALSLNPFMWKSFASLCKLGDKVDTQQVFQMNPDFSFGTANLVHNSENILFINNIPSNTTLNANVTPDNNQPVRTPMAMSTIVTPEVQAPVKKLHSVFSGITPMSFSPSFSMLPMEESPMYTPTLTDSNEQKAIPKIVNSFRAQMGQLKDAVFNPAPRCTLGPAPRRSSRLFSNNSSYSVKENNKSPSRKFVAPKSPSRKNKQRSTKNNLKSNSIETNDRNKSIDALTPTMTTKNPKNSNGSALLNLLRDLGEAYKALCNYDCKNAIKLFQKVPPKQLNSPWVQTMIARAHYELAQYEAAAKIFVEIRKEHPCRTEGMDVYSTCLWHLQREAQLSALAQELVELNRKDPIAWLVTGNCFSLHKERETALKFFRRAVQVDPESSYAHALLGHEYVAAEETDKALASFRAATNIDGRNYVAWFGMATVYARQERWRTSEAHIRKALTIHPHSGVLRCQLGLAQSALGKTERALATFDKAVLMNPENPLCRFHRASVLFRAGRPQDALTDLHYLKDIAPRESVVYYLLGKVHNKLGNSHLALMHFSWATDLDPKCTSGHIKEGFDTSKQEDPTERST